MYKNIKTLIEDEKAFPKNSRNCLITQNKFIEYLDTDENQIYYIRVYDIDLNFIKKLELEKNNHHQKEPIIHIIKHLY